MSTPLRMETLVPILAAHRAWVDRAALGAPARLSQVSLRGLDLRGETLAEAELGDADLAGAILAGVSLRGADLSFASLRGADLRGADLRHADLRCAALDGADLGGAVFTGAHLDAASFEGARMSWFDHTLIAERLWRAAGESVELRMVAAFIQRTEARCWDDYRELSPRHRRWILANFAVWRRDGDEAPPLLSDGGRHG